MLFRLRLLIIALLCFLPTTGYALEKVRVVILPFEIHAREELSYMKTEVPKVIKEHLKREGAVVLEPDITVSSREQKAETLDGIRYFGIEKGADYVIWGSLTWIGKKFSLDAKMIESFGEEPPSVFFLEGENIENLPGILKDLAQNFGMKLFKREKVANVIIDGNKRIETDAIKRVIKTKPGDVYLAKSLSEDLKAVYSMGYFDDIRVEAEKGPDGKTIIFKVKEKPTIRVIHIKGNKNFKDEEIKETLTLRTGSILNIFKIQNNIQRIETLYKEDNYHNVNVTYNVRPLKQNQADLDFINKEGKKVLIRKILFEGNSSYSNKKLKKIMKTSEKGFFSFLTESGDLNMEDLNQDTAKLSAFYHNNGYIQAKVGEPQIESKDKWIHIKIKIDEGPRFKIGKVDLEGDFVVSKKKLLKKLKIVKETFYNRQILRNDVLTLVDLYSDEGYAFTDITPRIDKDFEKLVVNITCIIDKGKQVYFEKIIIGGNIKTRDKIIRRELRVYEQELYSGRQLKRSVRNLYRLDYFEDIKVDTVKGSSDDKMILKIDVTEKPTGSFTFGGGYSSVENLFAMGSLSQKNLFGRGQTLALKAELGENTTRYTLSFTEPWLFDIPLSAGFDLYNWEKDYDEYDKDSIGGGVRFGYPVYDFTRAYLSYAYESADVRNIATYAAKSIEELEGTNVTSSITTKLRYDSRNRIFNPSEGSDHSATVQYAGLGGDIAFTKLQGETGWYIPLIKSTVGFLHAASGYVTENSGGKLPDYERFYLGGINSLRGFKWRDISARDEDGARIGGEKFMQFNAEFTFPLVKSAGFGGVIFFDTGNVYGNNENIDLGNMRETAGFGFRWYSPVGPIRLENGYILDPKEGESTDGRWEFAMGMAF